MIESADTTSVNALGFSVTLFLGVLLLILPRRYAPIPLLMIGAYMTYGQILNVAGIHFTMLRVMILIGWVRIIGRGEARQFRFNTLDKVFLCWIIAHVAISIMREQTNAAITFNMGYAYNAVGLYFLFRFIVRDLDEYEVIIKSLAIIMIPLAVLMVVEYTTGKNPFSIFGGVPEYTVIRNDRLRCQGPFRHPILSGTFGATTLPLVIALFYKQKARVWAIIGALAALTIVFTSASSGPLLAVVGVVIGFSVWPLRNHMQVVRWGLLALLVGLHVIMKAPVWYLISRISEITGGTGWHRSELINQAIIHFDQWWLMGTSDTAGWLPYHLSLGSGESADITNQFISEGVNGGIITLILFVAVIIYCYKNIGKELKRKGSYDLYVKIAIWSIGVCLFAHILSFLSVTYFDQMQIYWYMLLAVISMLGLNDTVERQGVIGIYANRN